MEAFPHLIPADIGQLTVRRPTSAELAGRVQFVITDRDQDMLAAVATHGFLTVELLSLAFYPLQAGPLAVSARAYWRIRQLWLWGFLERVELPVPRGFKGSKPSLYMLGPQGVPYAEQRLERGVSAIVRRVDRLDAASVPHNLVTAALWTNLVASLHGTNGTVSRWIPERVLRGKKIVLRDPDNNYRLPVLPDAYFEVSYDDRTEVQACFLEVDMGTLTRERFRRKLQAFRYYQSWGLSEQHWGRRWLNVLVIVPSVARRDELMALTKETLREAWWGWIGFLTVDALDPLRFDQAPWWWVDGDRRRLLLTPTPMPAAAGPASQ
jgi:hypothetical protein